MDKPTFTQAINGIEDLASQMLKDKNDILNSLVMFLSDKHGCSGLGCLPIPDERQISRIPLMEQLGGKVKSMARTSEVDYIFIINKAWTSDKKQKLVVISGLSPGKGYECRVFKINNNTIDSSENIAGGEIVGKGLLEAFLKGYEQK